MNSIFQLVYISQAAEDLSYSDIHNILTTSRGHNAQAKITGVLLLRDGYFVQVLEGDQATILSLVSRIKEDRRNHSLRVISEEFGQERLFSNWAMAFLDGDIQANHSQEMLDFFQHCQSEDHSLAESIVTLVRRFSGSQLSFQ